MRLAIADPPYLGRSVRWYGDGRGVAGGRGRADHHPEAGRWDDPAAHVDLLAHLEADFDGYALAMAVDTLPLYLAHVTRPARVMVWHRRNAPPSGSRILGAWEPVLVRVPTGRLGRAGGRSLSDVLDEPAPRGGFVGAKPRRWVEWVLDALGYAPGDEVADLFPGSGAIAAVVDALLPLADTTGQAVTPPACCRCCYAASERGELDHAPGDACPYPPCPLHQPEDIPA